MTERHTTGERFNELSILDHGVGQHPGFLGECAFALWCMQREVSFYWVGSDKGQIDFKIMSDRELTFDVKAKERNVEPRSEYDAHVKLQQKDYHCDAYVFVSVTRDKPTIMGWIPKKKFWELATIMRKGQKDERGRPELVDCAKMKYADLYTMEALEQWL